MFHPWLRLVPSSPRVDLEDAGEEYERPVVRQVGRHDPYIGLGHNEVEDAPENEQGGENRLAGKHPDARSVRHQSAWSSASSKTWSISSTTTLKAQYLGPVRKVRPVLLILGFRIVPIGKDESVVRQVGYCADRARVPFGRIVERGVVLKGRDLPVRGDHGEEVETSQSRSPKSDIVVAPCIVGLSSLSRGPIAVYLIPFLYCIALEICQL